MPKIASAIPATISSDGSHLYFSKSRFFANLSAQYNQVLNFQVRNCLVELDNNNEATPELAESWEPSIDAVTWNFKIRKGVEFHNGKTLEAKDVVYSINHHRDEKSKLLERRTGPL